MRLRRPKRSTIVTFMVIAVALALILPPYFSRGKSFSGHLENLFGYNRRLLSETFAQAGHEFALKEDWADAKTACDYALGFSKLNVEARLDRAEASMRLGLFTESELDLSSLKDREDDLRFLGRGPIDRWLNNALYAERHQARGLAQRWARIGVIVSKGSFREDLDDPNWRPTLARLKRLANEAP